jgi:hypothetical protein
MKNLSGIAGIILILSFIFSGKPYSQFTISSSYKPAEEDTLELTYADSVLVNEKLQPGEYEIPFNAAVHANGKLASGIYFYTLETEKKRN